MGYCFTCGKHSADLDAAAMCGPCRRDWRPSAPVPGDLGYRGGDPA